MTKRTMRVATLLLLVLASYATVQAAEAVRPFSVVLLPDTQCYSEKFPDTYMRQTNWIKDQAEADNIKFAIHLGDIVETAAHENEWKVADKAHAVLDGVVPYSVLPGNHDLDCHDDVLTRETSMYHKYFPPSRFEGQAWYGGHMGDDNACNYTFFEEGDLKFMVLSFALAPSDAMIAWASDVVKQHPNHRVIVATHYYMRVDGRGNDRGTYNLKGCDGEMLWQKFIRKHANIFMVVSGHILGVHHQVSINDAGKPVIEILSDYQGEANGGDGWLQTMRFKPAENTIDVVAYSPTLDAYNKEPAHTYSLDYVMSGTAEDRRFVTKLKLPTGQTAIIAEGEFETRSIGSFSVRLYQAAEDDHAAATLFTAGLILERDGTIEQVKLANTDDTNQSEIVVIVRSAGTGGYLSAHAFAYNDEKLTHVGSVGDRAAEADVVEALREAN